MKKKSDNQPKIIFIILQMANKHRIVCDIVEKLFMSEARTIILVNDDQEGEQIDKMLWTWKQHSFIPHSYHNNINDPQDDPVLVTKEIINPGGYDHLIQIKPCHIENLKSFKLVIDFAEQYNQTKVVEDRNRYKLYKENAFNLSALNPGQFLAETLNKV